MTEAAGKELESDNSYTRYSILTPDEPEPYGSEGGSETIVDSDEDEDEDEVYVRKGQEDEEYEDDNTEVDELVDEFEEEQEVDNCGDDGIRNLPTLDERDEVEAHTPLPLHRERTTFRGPDIESRAFASRCVVRASKRADVYASRCRDCTIR